MVQMKSRKRLKTADPGMLRIRDSFWDRYTKLVTEEVLPMIRQYGFYPGRDFLRSLRAYNDALDKCIKATHDHDWEGMREISDELQKHLERLNAAFPMSGTPKKDVVVVGPTAQDTPTS